MDNPERLNVMYDGLPLGCVEVASRSPRKIIGRLVLDKGFAGNHQLIEEARTCAKRFDASHDNRDGLDHLAFDKYIEVIKRLTAKIAFPELPITIEEFAVGQDLGVEVTLGSALE